MNAYAVTPEGWRNGQLQAIHLKAKASSKRVRAVPARL
jgi:hypothetical protein